MFMVEYNGFETVGLPAFEWIFKSISSYYSNFLIKLEIVPDIKSTQSTLHREYFQKLINGEIIGVMRKELISPVKCVKDVTNSQIYDEIVKIAKKANRTWPFPPTLQRILAKKILWKLDNNHHFFSFINENEAEELKNNL